MSTPTKDLFYGHELEFTRVPMLLIRWWKRLGLTAPEYHFVLAVLSYKWTEKDPFPSIASIQEHLGLKYRQGVQNLAQSLEKKGFLRRRIEEARDGQNFYDLSGLFQKLAAFNPKSAEPAKVDLPVAGASAPPKKLDLNKLDLHKLRLQIATKVRARGGKPERVTTDALFDALYAVADANGGMTREAATAAVDKVIDAAVQPREAALTSAQA